MVNYTLTDKRMVVSMLLSSILASAAVIYPLTPKPQLSRLVVSPPLQHFLQTVS